MAQLIAAKKEKQDKEAAKDQKVDATAPHASAVVS